MLRGEDFIGIVPVGVDPGYSQHHFPVQDEIVEVICPEGEIRRAVEARALWYPIPFP